MLMKLLKNQEIIQVIEADPRSVDFTEMSEPLIVLERGRHGRRVRIGRLHNRVIRCLLSVNVHGKDKYCREKTGPEHRSPALLK